MSDRSAGIAASATDSSELAYLSATEARRLFRARELSPVELMEALIDRAERLQPSVNAFSHTFFDDALAQARTAEAAYGRGEARPLEGIPLAVKNEVDHAGRPNSNGSFLLRDTVATETAVFLQRLLDAGAIVHARTNVPEFCLHSQTFSMLHGVTRNPWNLAYGAGGSSGGAGAALAAGMTTLATGSDIGGSIRIPASQNGVIGFKPPYGRVPGFAPWNLDDYCHDGPMARTVDDVILCENHMTGPYERDIVSLYPTLMLPAQYEAVRGMHVALVTDFGYRDVDEDVLGNTLAAAERLRSLGVQVEQVDLAWSDAVDEAALDHLCALAGNRVLQELEHAGVPPDSQELNPYIRGFLARVPSVTIQDFLRSRDVESAMYNDIGPLLNDFDALLCPTMALASVPADWDWTREPLSINGIRQPQRLACDAMTHYFNMLSRCPVLSVPSGFDRNGVPTGLQLVAAPYRDEVVFRLAKAWESAGALFVDGAIPGFRGGPGG